MSLRAILVDDEPQARSTLRSLLTEYCPSIVITGEAGTVEKACRIIMADVPDVVFLDMELHDRNGFDILYDLPSNKLTFLIVVVTGYEKYGIQAVNEGATYYLLKPVDIDELIAITDRLGEKLQQRPTRSVIEQTGDSPFSPPRLSIPDNNGKHHLISVEELMYCIPKGNYCCCYFRDTSKMMLYSSMKKLSEILPKDRFIRIHSSCIVNIQHIHEYIWNNTEGFVILTNGTTVNVSRRHRKRLLQKLT